ncbi:MAG TPA: hypothetical protein VF128_12465 [Gemmatimonadaceae bacterium]
MTRLESHVRESGVDCRVEVRDRLAIVVPERSVQLSAEQRRQILQLAKSEGFTHVAVELDPVGAALPGD